MKESFTEWSPEYGVDDQLVLKSWRSILLSGHGSSGGPWHDIRGLRGTLYGRTIFRQLMMFLSDGQNFDVLLDMVEECPSVIHPELVVFDDPQGALKDVEFLCDEDDDPWTGDWDSLQLIEELPESMRGFKSEERRAALMEMPVSTLSKLHSLDVIKKAGGRKLRVVGRNPETGNITVAVEPAYGRCEPSDWERMFIEDNYPVLLMRDIALHSMITGDEVLIEVMDDEDWIPDPDRVDVSVKTSIVSSLDCGWLLSPTEKTVARFLNVVYRTISYGFYNDMINKSPDSFSDELWDALWEEASTDHEIILHVKDQTVQWAWEPGRRLAVMAESIPPEGLETSMLRLGGSDDLSEEGEEGDLRELLASLLVQTNRHAFDQHAQCTNKAVTFFQSNTYSVVLDATRAAEELIDPLVPLPERAFEADMSFIIKTFEALITQLSAQDEIKVQYLGRRKTDGRLVFVYTDADGRTIIPESVVRITG